MADNRESTAEILDDIDGVEGFAEVLLERRIFEQADEFGDALLGAPLGVLELVEHRRFASSSVDRRDDFAKSEKGKDDPAGVIASDFGGRLDGEDELLKLSILIKGSEEPVLLGSATSGELGGRDERLDVLSTGGAFVVAAVVAVVGGGRR